MNYKCVVANKELIIMKRNYKRGKQRFAFFLNLCYNTKR